MDLQLVDRCVFESFDQQHIDGCEVFLQDGGGEPLRMSLCVILRVSFLFLVTFVHQRPSSFGGDQNLVCSCLAMRVGVFAFVVDIEAVVSVFHSGDAQALGRELFQQGYDEPSFAATAPSCEAYNLHLATFIAPFTARASLLFVAFSFALFKQSEGVARV